MEWMSPSPGLTMRQEETHAVWVQGLKGSTELVVDRRLALEVTGALCTPAFSSNSLAQFTTYRDSAGEWRWNLKAANHEAIASGEGYVNKSDCQNAVDLVKSSSNAPVREA